MFFSFQNITHKYGEKPLFEDVGYTILSGELLVIKGSNGSGKTSLLKILAGLVKPKNGFIFYDFGSNTKPSPPPTLPPQAGGGILSIPSPVYGGGLGWEQKETLHEISEDYKAYHKHINYLGHNNAVDPLLTTRENLEFWANLGGVKEAIAPASKFFKLEDVLDIECGKLSAGWNRRVALARLMLKRTKLWILDEPFANLDSEVIDLTLSAIASFCDQGGMVILSSHQEVKIPFGVEMVL